MLPKIASIQLVWKMPGSIVANRAFALVTLILFLSGSLLAQGFVQQTGTANPMAGIDVRLYSASAFADLDSDGDPDLVLGAGNSNVVFYYRNTGTSSAPVFTQASNLFTPDPTPGGANFYPALGDVDGDGKLDAVIGNGDGILFFYKNTGTATSPAFTQQAGAANPFAGIDIGGYAAPTLGDPDGDGDLDLIVSDHLGGGNPTAYYKNTGTRTVPVYVQQTGGNNPLSTLPDLPRPVLGDIDKDGDLDIVSGTFEGRLLCFLNIGTVTAPVFTDRTDLLSNFYIEFNLRGTILPDYTLPGLADLDGDGDLDLAVGGFLGTLAYLKNVLQITRQPVPASVTVCPGSNVSTTIQTSGDGTRTYQWYRNSRSTATPVPGQTSATLNLNNVQANNAGVYYALVGGAGVSIWSEPFTLTVNTPTVTNPDNVATCPGTPVSVRVTGGGGGTLSYQWYRGNTALTNGGNSSISGATTATLTILNPGSSDAATNYNVRVSSTTGCTITSANASLFVYALPATPTVNVTQPTCTTATGTITLNTPIETGITYSINGIAYQTSNIFNNLPQGSYRVTAKNSSGCVSSANQVAIFQQPSTPATPTSIVTQPTCSIATGTITVNTPGGTGITYSINGTNYQASNLFSDVTPGNYSITARNSSGCTSAAIAVMINTAPETPAAPTVTVTQPGCSTPNGTIIVSGPTGTVITYSINSTDYQASNTFNNVAPGNYNVTAKNSSSCVSAATPVTINTQPATPAKPTITASGPTMFCPGGSITLTATTGAAYQWSNGNTTQSITVNQSGSYSVVVKNSDGCSSPASDITTVTVVDNEKPVITCPAAQQFCFSSTGNYTVPSLSATDNCGIQSITYTITGATQRNGTGNNASGSFAPGTSTIAWTVADASNNVSTCSTTVVVNSPIVVIIPDSKALNSSGVAVNTVYVGYAPASSITLTANTSGGTGNHTYLWSTGATTTTITVSPTTNTTYTVTVKDGSNCTGTAAKTINVVDVRCGNKLDKVSVCHNGNTLCISDNAVPTHLNHGDQLGACNSAIASRTTTTSLIHIEEKEAATLATMVYPNPSNGQFTVQLHNNTATRAEVQIADAKGIVIERKPVQLIKGSQNIQFNLGNKAGGMYLVKVTDEKGVQTIKMIIQR